MMVTAMLHIQPLHIGVAVDLSVNLAMPVAMRGVVMIKVMARLRRSLLHWWHLVRLGLVATRPARGRTSPRRACFLQAMASSDTGGEVSTSAGNNGASGSRGPGAANTSASTPMHANTDADCMPARRAGGLRWRRCRGRAGG